MKKISPLDFQSQTKVSNEIKCNFLKTSYFFCWTIWDADVPNHWNIKRFQETVFLLYLLPFTPQRHPYHQQCPSHALPVHGDLFPANRFTVALNEDLSSAARVVYHCLGDTNTCGNRNGPSNTKKQPVPPSTNQVQPITNHYCFFWPSVLSVLSMLKNKSKEYIPFIFGLSCVSQFGEGLWNISKNVKIHNVQFKDFCIQGTANGL